MQVIRENLLSPVDACCLIKLSKMVLFESSCTYCSHLFIYRFGHKQKSWNGQNKEVAATEYEQNGDNGSSATQSEEWIFRGRDSSLISST